MKDFTFSDIYPIFPVDQDFPWNFANLTGSSLFFGGPNWTWFTLRSHLFPWTHAGNSRPVQATRFPKKAHYRLEQLGTQGGLTLRNPHQTFFTGRSGNTVSFAIPRILSLLPGRFDPLFGNQLHTKRFNYLWTPSSCAERLFYGPFFHRAAIHWGRAQHLCLPPEQYR